MSGKKEWFIADGFMSSTKNDQYVSHEAVCVLNTTNERAEINITVFFENSDPIKDFIAVCDPERTNHIRLDKIKNAEGKCIPKDTPYALFIESSVPVICQHSRMDVSNKHLTLMTTMAY